MGSNFIHFLFKNFNRAKVINLDLLTYAGNKENLKGIPANRHKFVKGDIADTDLVKRLMKQADFVVNFAAETHVDRSIHGSYSDFLRANVLGVHSLLEALKHSPNIKRMIHVSTDEVWGDLDLKSKEKFHERSPLKPNSPYAASKAAGDLLAISYVKTYGLPVIISRSVNNFGPRQYPEKLIPFFAMRAMQSKLLPLYGDGKNMRDWLYVDDHSAALLMLLKRGAVGDVYPVSRGEEYSNLEIAREILKTLKKPENLITFVQDRPGHDRRYSVDSSKLRRLGWQPKHSLESRLAHTIKWYDKNKPWLKSVLNKNSGVNPHIKI
ncbi:MAG: dTDP-glucose 4,6-dehydratase [Candidatus Giovannonibacteria bacterium GW2011_GWC2_44_9]|uniref:dTDP-glucose 4,6-dehydratase n=3 Tax=Candidatus Giovannoniibacteriota TaxID=1752738 RepID=A0A0G1LX64_9BACT|nr:MAG: dTDP-glucose 4,6-dehydratase [Candidatus Giovannonibacteria bacterium GW2011_GWB1_44_23]KKT64319.1 MAG: dTDP-glucose 4,6-dehydratase [Candidatus Giovannonibacteria bacterium GW2011_GWA1_44_29]KKT84273.1 MAG: dTDP-glucose 4,6-dehydratase [Candidatus Giovannonibacteria bacterium GW2011_GWC2_44_9]KKT92046.1 MAG: dTDP-glucose 4,6-dehydratase [Parcubacteria group bacterium GW2011_GWC1_45_13]